MNHVNINGNTYPLKLGMLAMRKIGKRKGGLQEIVECLQSDNDDIRDQATFEMAFALIENGIAVQAFERGDDAPFLPALKSPEHIAAVISPTEYVDLYTVLTKTIIEDAHTTVQPELTDVSKNAVATPGN